VTILPLSCAYILEILRAPISCNPRGLSRSVQGLLYLFVRNKHVMDFKHMRKKIGLMSSVEVFFVHKWAIIDNQLRKKSKEDLIIHPEL
jgi:hypothetical protein